MWRHRGGMPCTCPGRLLEVSRGIVEAKHVTSDRHSSSAVDLTNTNSCQLKSTHMTPTNCSRITSQPKRLVRIPTNMGFPRVKIADNRERQQRVPKQSLNGRKSLAVLALFLQLSSAAVLRCVPTKSHQKNSCRHSINKTPKARLPRDLPAISINRSIIQ